MYSLQRASLSFCILVFLCLHFVATTNGADCDKSQQEWLRVRYTTMVGSMFTRTPYNPNFGSNICPIRGARSCCDHHTEREMYTLGQQYLANQVNSNWLRVAEQLNNDSATLEYFFRSDLEQAKDRLHQFFSRIYGYNYKLHRRFFFQLFTDLEAYIVGQRRQLDQLVENFFSQLRDSMVSLMERSGQLRSNSHSFGSNRADGIITNSNDGYITGTDNSVDENAETRRIRCLSDRVARLRPFDDVDVRLKTRMLEAYPPARMLVNVLSVAGRLLSQLIHQVSTRPECALAMTRSQFCAICAGKLLNSICPNSCPKLMSSCLLAEGPANSQLREVWPRLIDAIIITSGRLERSFNFPAVNRHLQMEISEAITSLQTRYEQTKSKFESECRTASSGRSAPTLFSASGSTHRASHGTNEPSPHLSRWSPPQFTRHRHKRNIARPHTPELLAWQHGSVARPRDFQLRYDGYAHSPQTYGAFDRQQQHQQPNPAWDSSSQDVPSDIPERLMRWVTQLKHTYTALGNMFAAPGASLCPSNALSATSNESECWNPPDITNTTPDQGITQAVRVISDAIERLRQVASTGGDPDAIVLPPSIPTSSSALPPSPAISSPDLQDPSLHQPAYAPHPVAPNQWNSPTQDGPFDSFDSRGAQTEMFGSGMGGNNWDAFSPMNQQHKESYGDLQPPPPQQQGPMSPDNPLLTNYGSIGGQPMLPVGMEGSGAYGDYSPYQLPDNNHWLSPNTQNTGYEHAGDPQRPSIVEPVEPVTTSPLHLSSSTTPFTSTFTTTVMTSTSAEPDTTGGRSEISEATATIAATTTTTTLTSTSATLSMVTTETATHNLTTVATGSTTSATPSRHLTSQWPVTDYVRDTTTLSVTTQSTPITRPTNRVFDPQEFVPPSYGGFPDDEDTVQQPSFNELLPPSHTTTSSSLIDKQAPWPSVSGPDRDQASWFETPYTQGSGFPDLYGDPNRLPTHQDPDRLDMSAPELSPHYPTFGSGQPVDPSTSTGVFGGVPQEGGFPYAPAPGEHFAQPTWSHPAQPDSIPQNSGMMDNEFLRWQEHTPGSAFYEPPRPSPPIVESVTDPIPEPVVTSPPPVKSQPVLPHLFLPPPEVWVPAKIGPGRPFPSVLLVREYNVQGPFYGSDVIHSQENGAAHTITLHVNTILFFSVLFYHMLYE